MKYSLRLTSGQIVRPHRKTNIHYTYDNEGKEIGIPASLIKEKISDAP